MKKVKNILYYGTVILPVLRKLISSIKFIIEFNRTNQDVLAARNQIVEEIKYLQEVIKEINDFHHLNSLDED